MAYLNANIPPVYCKIRREYLYDLREHQGETEDCVVFGLGSISGRAILFHVTYQRCVYWRLPISAFFKEEAALLCIKTKCPNIKSTSLQLWNSFSYYPSVTVFDFLVGERGKYLGKDKKFYHGHYLFTIDWASPDPNLLDVEHSEIPEEHKCAHILALDNGNYAAQPNNRMLWNISSYTTNNNVPDYKVQTTEWSVENKGWTTDETDNMFYQVEDKK
jgi:hypothetical protein